MIFRGSIVRRARTLNGGMNANIASYFTYTFEGQDRRPNWNLCCCITRKLAKGCAELPTMLKNGGKLVKNPAGRITVENELERGVACGEMPLALAQDQDVWSKKDEEMACFEDISCLGDGKSILIQWRCPHWVV